VLAFTAVAVGARVRPVRERRTPGPYVGVYGAGGSPRSAGVYQIASTHSGWSMNGFRLPW
jgi:hypothetical protein